MIVTTRKVSQHRRTPAERIRLDEGGPAVLVLDRGEWLGVVPVDLLHLWMTGEVVGRGDLEWRLRSRSSIWNDWPPGDLGGYDVLESKLRKVAQ